MKKKGLAIMIAAVTIGTTVGSTALYYAKGEARQNVSEKLAETVQTENEILSGTEETDDTAASSGEAADVSENNIQSAELASLTQEDAGGQSADFPVGQVDKADYTDVSREEALSSGVSDVVENTMPTLVSITATSLQNVEDWFRGRVYQRELSSAGSGVIIGENEDELLIVTNNHVVEGASELTVTFIDEESCNAVVKGTDSDNDLAVVAVSLDDIGDDTIDQIRVVNVADPDDIKVGQQVIAIGNALGYGQSVTTGIVSALHREISVQEGYSVMSFDELIQTDAAINFGNSGGALLNMRGELIGINCAKNGLSEVEDMGYAIPTSKAIPIIQDLMNKETRTRVSEEDAAYIGINGQDMTMEVVQLYGLPAGVYITAVEAGTPAEEAGLEEGMILTEFGDYDITSMRDLQDALSYFSGGETVSLSVAVQSDNGGYEEKEMEITLGYRSDYDSYIR